MFTEIFIASALRILLTFTFYFAYFNVRCPIGAQINIPLAFAQYQKLQMPVQRRINESKTSVALRTSLAGLP